MSVANRESGEFRTHRRRAEARAAGLHELCNIPSYDK